MGAGIEEYRPDRLEVVDEVADQIVWNRVGEGLVAFAVLEAKVEALADLYEFPADADLREVLPPHWSP